MENGSGQLSLMTHTSDYCRYQAAMMMQKNPIRPWNRLRLNLWYLHVCRCPQVVH